MEMIAGAAGVKEEDVLGSDLYVYNRMQGSVWGAGEEFISAGRLDDLECVYSSLTGFLDAKDGDSIPVHCVMIMKRWGAVPDKGLRLHFLQIRCIVSVNPYV